MTRVCSWAVVAAATVLAGCASTPNGASSRPITASEPAQRAEVVHFDPAPVAETGEQDLQPIRIRPASELLADAAESFRAANDAHKRGDELEAYQQYTQMMELLLQADLDPTVFYNLQNEFSSILNTSTRLVRTYEKTQPESWSQEVIEMALRSELEYPNPLNRRVMQEIEAIQRVYPKSFQAGLNRSARYLPYVREEFEKAGLPQDLVWLAMVESQFTPRINSHAGASGMWQFMKSTGRRYGLRSDFYVEERYDWKKATDAAIQYLSELYELFDGSWPLAVTAYNMGEAGLERAIASAGGERNLWRLIETPPASNRIRLESKRFYAKLLASAIVANDPETYGFKIDPQPEDDTTTINVTGFYSLAQLEEAAGFPSGTLSTINPHLLRGHTPPGRTVAVSVPAKERTRLASALESTPELRPGTHTIQRGETLSEIASLYRVPVREIQSVNNIRDARRIQIGQRLVIPGGVNMSGGSVVAASASGDSVYTVRRGDSLSRIASRHRVSVRDLQAWNNLGSRTRIHVGDRLVVAAAAPSSAEGGTQDVIMHTVVKGEFPGKIAKAYGVPVNDLLRWNGLTSRSTIDIGQQLKVYVPGRAAVSSSRTTVASNESTAAQTPRKHTVRRGENPSVIASKYRIRTSDLLRWNGLTSRSVLQIGDTLLIDPPAKVQTTSAPSAEEVKLAAASSAPSGTVRVLHSVRNGESPWLIARQHDVTLDELFEWNGWSKTPVLHVGDEVVILKPATP